MSSRAAGLVIRQLRVGDYDYWRPLWDAYNSFYGRAGASALPNEITRETWIGLTTSDGPLHGLLAERDGEAVGLAHYLFHPSTTVPAGVCYLQDLIVVEGARRHGVGNRLIEAVKSASTQAGVPRVYWHTQEDNAPAISLYEKVGHRTGFIVFAARS